MSLTVRLQHRFAGFTLDASFSAPAGVTALFGRSGSGKTSIINAVAGLLRPDRARIEVDGTVLADSATGLHLPPHRRRIGYVFQDARLFPHLSVRQNLDYGGRFAPDPPDAAGFDQIVALLDIAALLQRRPAKLSGGETARVAIGRALLSRPRLLLMDEPLAALDEARRAEILPYIERLRDETRVPIVYVSHSLAEVARLATTIVVLDAGQVRLAGPAAQVLSDPAAAPVLGLREAGAVLEGRVVAHHPDGLSELAVAAGRLLLPQVAAPAGTLLRVRILAHDVILARSRPEGLSALNILPALVTLVHQGDGPGVLVQLDAGGDLLLARVTRRSAEALGLAPGVACHAILKSVAVAQSDVGRAGAGVGNLRPN